MSNCSSTPTMRLNSSLTAVEHATHVALRAATSSESRGGWKRRKRRSTARSSRSRWARRDPLGDGHFLGAALQASKAHRRIRDRSSSQRPSVWRNSLRRCEKATRTINFEPAHAWETGAASARGRHAHHGSSSTRGGGIEGGGRHVEQRARSRSATAASRDRRPYVLAARAAAAMRATTSLLQHDVLVGHASAEPRRAGGKESASRCCTADCRRCEACDRPALEACSAMPSRPSSTSASMTSRSPARGACRAARSRSSSMTVSCPRCTLQ